MRAETRAIVDDWWAGNLGCARADLWQGVHVSTPSVVSVEEAESLAIQGFESLTDPRRLCGVRRTARRGDQPSRLAVWLAVVGNGASLAFSRDLGFEIQVHQLAVRPTR